MGKKILKQYNKPSVKFICDLCKTEWLDNEYKILEKPSPMGHFMGFANTKQESPASNCPVCKMKSYSSKVYNALKVEKEVTND